MEHCDLIQLESRYRYAMVVALGMLSQHLALPAFVLKMQKTAQLKKAQCAQNCNNDIIQRVLSLCTMTQPLKFQQTHESEEHKRMVGQLDASYSVNLTQMFKSKQISRGVGASKKIFLLRAACALSIRLRRAACARGSASRSSVPCGRAHLWACRRRSGT